MTKDIVATKTLVNLEPDEVLSQPWQSAAVDTLADRLRWILENRAGGNERELARLAELPSETHVGLILDGKVKEPRTKTLSALAKAGRVEFAWLATGNGPRDLPSDMDQTVLTLAELASERVRAGKWLAKTADDAIRWAAADGRQMNQEQFLAYGDGLEREASGKSKKVPHVVLESPGPDQPAVWPPVAKVAESPGKAYVHRDAKPGKAALEAKRGAGKAKKGRKG